MPERYVRPELELQLLVSETASSSSSPPPQAPVIDMTKLLSPDFHASELHKLDYACKYWGFFQIVSNGIYKSIEHRATVDSKKESMSMATFYNAISHGKIGHRQTS